MKSVYDSDLIYFEIDLELYQYILFTEVAPIKKANIFVIEVTVMETPANFNANPTLSYAGSCFSFSVRLSID